MLPGDVRARKIAVRIARVLLGVAEWLKQVALGIICGLFDVDTDN